MENIIDTVKSVGKVKFIEDFKAFAMKGNVIDMAVGVVIGGAFGKIVTSLVNDIIMPLVGLLLGGFNFNELSVVLKRAVVNEAGAVVRPEVTLNYGNFIQVTVDFLIIAFSIFLVIRLIGSMKRKEAAAPAPAPQPPVKSDEVKLLEEIRDLMKNK